MQGLAILYFLGFIVQISISCKYFCNFIFSIYSTSCKLVRKKKWNQYIKKTIQRKNCLGKVGRYQWGKRKMLIEG